MTDPREVPKDEKLAPGHLALTHPFTLGVFLTLSLWRERTGGSGELVSDLLGSVAATLLVAAVAWFAARLLTADKRKRALLALFAVLWSLLFGSAQVWMITGLDDRFGSPALALGLWTLIVAMLVLLVLRAKSDLAGMSRALGAAGYALVLVGIVNVFKSTGEDAAVSSKWTDTRSAERPDVFVLVLDKYTSGEWLKHNFRLDHQPMEDSLRALGFVVPRGAHTNYVHTRLSLTSLLEGSLLDREALGMGRADYDALTTRVRDAAIWSEAADRGYRVAFFPSNYEGTRDVTRASLVMVPPEPEAETNEFAESFVVNSPLAASAALACAWQECEPDAAAPYEFEPWSTIEWKLETFASLPDSAGPVFAFLHLLAPHEPYLFSDDCSLREPWWPLTDRPPTNDDSLRAAYAAQVRCLDVELLSVLTTLRAKAPNAAIIVTGDHGHGRFAVDVLRGVTQERDELTPEQLGGRFGVFMALRLPDAERLVREDIPIVHLMPLLRHTVFGDSLVLGPDSLFWSSYQHSLEFTAVEKSRSRPGSIASPASRAGATH